jgi:hypothetical protein
MQNCARIELQDRLNKWRAIFSCVRNQCSYFHLAANFIKNRSVIAQVYLSYTFANKPVAHLIWDVMAQWAM